MGLLDVLNPFSAITNLVGGIISNNAKNKAEQQQRAADNAFMQKSDAAKAGVLSNLQASGWNPYGMNTLHSGSSGSSSTSGRSSTSFANQSHKITEAANQGMEDKLRSLIEGRLGTASVGAGEKANAIRAINQATAGAQRQIQNLVGARGAAAPAAGAAFTPLATARSGQIAQYLGTAVPELQRTREMDLENQANQFLLPRMGESQSGVSNSNFSQNTNSNQSGWGQQAPDIGSALALSMPTGPAQTSNTGYSGFGTALQGAGALGSALLPYYANRQKTPGSLGMPSNINSIIGNMGTGS